MTISPGDKVVYRSLSGGLHGAEVRAVRLDGSLDIGVDTGTEPLELTRIKLAVPGAHWPGTAVVS